MSNLTTPLPGVMGSVPRLAAHASVTVRIKLFVEETMLEGFGLLTKVPRLWLRLVIVLFLRSGLAGIIITRRSGT